MFNVMVVEDIEATSVWMEALLKQAFPDVQTISCKSLAEAKANLGKQILALALVDLNLPDGRGKDLIPAIRQQDSETQIIVMTIFDDYDHIFSAIKAGVNGYLLKDQSEKLLINKLRGVMEGDPPLSPVIARKILEEMQQPNSNQGNNFKPIHIDLSKREKDILLMISKGLNRKEIAESMSLSPHTIAGHIRVIYQKLGVNSRSEAAIMAYRIGLIRNDDD